MGVSTEIGGRLKQADGIINKGFKQIDKGDEDLTVEKKASDSKTLLGASLGGADQSIKRGIGIDEKAVMKALKEQNPPHLTPSEKITP